MFGGQSFVAFHWRFEEVFAHINGNPIGLSISSTFANFSYGYGSVRFDVKDLIEVINHFRGNVSNIFLATDGRLRGQSVLVDKFKSTFSRDYGVHVKELGDAVQHMNLPLRAWEFAAIDRELCTQAIAFIGSTTSSWTWSIAADMGARNKDDEKVARIYDLRIEPMENVINFNDIQQNGAGQIYFWDLEIRRRHFEVQGYSYTSPKRWW